MPIQHFEPLGKVRTKIVATVGPASRSPAVLREMIEAGVNVFRLNFSHGTQDEHSATLALIREVADASGRMIAVLQDLGGPKIRLGSIPGDAVECHKDEEFILVADRTSEDPHQLTCTYRELPHDLKAGDAVLFADGAVAMVVMRSDAAGARMKVTLAGRLRSQQGINLPGAALSVKALTDKDLRDLDWTGRNPVEYVGLSFVRHAYDIIRLREELARRGSRARIIAKIEKPQAVANLDAIVAQSDAVMVARGDLGVEMDVARVPAIQKQVIAACHRARIPGDHGDADAQQHGDLEPADPRRGDGCVQRRARRHRRRHALGRDGHRPVSDRGGLDDEPDRARGRIADVRASRGRVDPRRPGSRSGARPRGLGPADHGLCDRGREPGLPPPQRRTARRGHALGPDGAGASKLRHATPNLALTDDAEIARAMALYWGVSPVHCPAITEGEEALGVALEWARSRELITRGDRLVLVQGTVPNNPSHNAMFVQEVE